MRGSTGHLLTDGREELDFFNPLVFLLLELLHLLLMLNDVGLELQYLGLHVSLFHTLLHKLSHENLLFFLEGSLVTCQAILFLPLLFQHVSNNCLLLFGRLHLFLELLDLGLNLHLLSKLLRDLLLDHLDHVLSVLNSTRIDFNVLGNHVLLRGYVVDLHLLLVDLSRDVALLHVVLVDHPSLLLDRIKHLLFLLLEGLIRLLLLLDVLLNGLGVGLKLLQVGLQVLHSLSEVLVTLADANGLIAVLHVLTLKGFDLVLIFLLISLHYDKLGIKVVVLSLFLLDPNLSAGNFGIHLLDLLGDTLDFRDQALSRLDLLVLDLVVNVRFVILKQVDFGLKCSTALLDGLDITVDITESVLKLLECLLILLLLLLCLLKVESLVHQLLGQQVSFRGQQSLDFELGYQLLVKATELREIAILSI